MPFVKFAASLLPAALFLGAGNVKTPAPAYNLATEVNITVTIEDVREVPKREALDGIHLSVKSKNDNFDVYVGPTAFVRLFDVTFKKGDEMELTGSRVNFQGEDLVLGRELRLGHVTLILRDKTGWPNWDWNRPPDSTCAFWRKSAIRRSFAGVEIADFPNRS